SFPIRGRWVGTGDTPGKQSVSSRPSWLVRTRPRRPSGRSAAPRVGRRPYPSRGLFESVLVANRGEIACRVLRTLRALGLRGAAVHSEADAGAKHVREADAAEPIGEAPAPASYLNPAAIVEAALRSGADAV